MPENNGVHEKIKKLLSLALNNPNTAEAEAALTKARELMVKHAVDEAKLHGEESVRDTEIFTINLDRSFETWMKLVQLAVSKLYGGQVYIGKKPGATRHTMVDEAYIVCSAADFELLKETYYQAVATILRESAVHVAVHTPGRQSATNFRVGAAEGFLDAVAKAIEAPLNKAGTAIVLVKSEAIAKRGEKDFPSARNKAMRYTRSDSEAYRSGYAFGSRMSTGKVTRKLEE